MKHTKFQKGESGYFQQSRRTAILIVALFAVIILGILLAGFLVYHTNKNYFTIAAVLLVLPAARFTVDLIIRLPHQPSAPSIVSAVKDTAPDLTQLFDCIISTTKSPVGVQAIVIANSVVCVFCTEKKTDIAFLKSSLTNFIQADGLSAAVTIYTDQTTFLHRIQNLQQESQNQKGPAIAASILRMCV